MAITNSPTFVVLLLAVWSVAPGCAPPTTGAAHDATKNAAERPAARVTTVRPQRKEIVRRTRQPGQIEAFQQTPLYAKVPGYVKRYHVDIGDPVKGPYYDRSGKLTDHGQLLAELSIPELDQDLQKTQAAIVQATAEVDQAKAALRVARAATALARAQFDQAQAAVDHAKAAREKWDSEYRRIRQLASKGTINSKVVDEAKNDFAAAQAACRDTEAKVEAASAAIEQSEANVAKAIADVEAAQARAVVAQAGHARTLALAEYTRIEAPYDGVVIERNVDVGHFVQPAEKAQTRPLFTVADTATVRVFVDVPETDAALVDRGDRAVVRVPSLPGKEFLGEVTRTSFALASATRTLRTEIDVPNPGGELRPSMYAYATIELDRRAKALTLPLTAIETADGKASCLCIADGKVVRKAVSLGLSDGKDVEIVSGLGGNDEVVEKNLSALAEGQPAVTAKSQTR